MKVNLRRLVSFFFLGGLCSFKKSGKLWASLVSSVIKALVGWVRKHMVEWSFWNEKYG